MSKLTKEDYIITELESLRGNLVRDIAQIDKAIKELERLKEIKIE